VHRRPELLRELVCTSAWSKATAKPRRKWGHVRERLNDRPERARTAEFAAASAIARRRRERRHVTGHATGGQLLNQWTVFGQRHERLSPPSSIEGAENSRQRQFASRAQASRVGRAPTPTAPTSRQDIAGVEAVVTGRDVTPTVALRELLVDEGGAGGEELVDGHAPLVVDEANSLVAWAASRSPSTSRATTGVACASDSKTMSPKPSCERVGTSADVPGRSVPVRQRRSVDESPRLEQRRQAPSATRRR
jgi:hypothetical protein